jgi:hypothetical protein
MAQADYFGMDRRWISVEVWAAEDSSACCGVNLAPSLVLGLIFVPGFSVR